MLGVFLIQHFKLILNTPGWWRKILPGGIMNLLPTLALNAVLTGAVDPVMGGVLTLAGLAVFLIAWGYLYRVFIDGLNGTEELVVYDWLGWRDYAIAGFWLFLIALGYCVLAAFFLGAIISMFGLTPSMDNPESAGPLSFLLILAMVFFYGFFPVAFTRYAAEGRLWAAFEPGPLWRDLKRVVSGAYIQTCFGLFGVSMMGNIVLGLLPHIGIALASFFWFLIMIVFARIFGLMIRRALTPPQSPVSSFN
jgi:hypothetical protein